DTLITTPPAMVASSGAAVQITSADGWYLVCKKDPDTDELVVELIVPTTSQVPTGGLVIITFRDGTKERRLPPIRLTRQEDQKAGWWGKTKLPLADVPRLPKADREAAARGTLTVEFAKPAA